MPQAGHFNENGGLPDADDDTVNQVLSQRASKNSVLLKLSCIDDYSEIEDHDLDAKILDSKVSGRFSANLQEISLHESFGDNIEEEQSFNMVSQSK